MSMRCLRPKWQGCVNSCAAPPATCVKRCDREDGPCCFHPTPPPSQRSRSSSYPSIFPCPCPQNTVITKCFHVFCHECVKTQIKTRQRKCPQCTVAFGDNDYERIYLT